MNNMEQDNNRIVKSLIIRVNGTREEIWPLNDEKFTLIELSNILNSVVEPLFFNEWWIFKSRNIFHLDINGEATRILGFPIYGDVIFIMSDMLSDTFFFPKEIISSMVDELKQQAGLESYDDTVNPKEPLDDESVNLIMQKIYSVLFESNKTYDQLLSSYKDGQGVDLILNGNKKESLDNLNKLLQYFINIEDYEKCKNIKELYKYLEDFMN